MLEEGCPLGEVVVSKKVQGVCQQRGDRQEFWQQWAPKCPTPTAAGVWLTIA